MTPQEELYSILDYIQQNAVVSGKSPSELSDMLMYLTAQNARTAEIMAEAKGMLHNARRAAYERYFTDRHIPVKQQPPVLLVKDYINDCCADQNALYELAERANRATVHAIDALRTVISAIKEEMKLSGYQNSAM